MTDELLTPREAAALMKVSVSAFHAWRRRHHIPNRVTTGRSVRVFRSDVVDERARPRVVDFAELGRRYARGESGVS